MLTLGLPSRALAYDEDVHAFLVRSGLARTDLVERPAPPITAGAPDAVRVAIDSWARTSTDAALRGEWLRRYPSPERFDAWAEKELLLLSPDAKVFGIDRLPELGPHLIDAVELGAREPDDDWRNRERLGHDETRRPLKDPKGADVPADPAILNMGKLGALSSQAHAHYGLAAVQFSSDPEVLKSDPRRFAVAAGYPPGPILTLAAEMTETHLDLALIAALMDDPSPTLAWLYTGQAFHYLQDVTNQIHTVQVGIYDFFVDATLERLKMAALTGGGYFGPLRSMTSIGIDILTNHHVLSEQLARKKLLEALAGKASPEGQALADAPTADDPDLARALDSLGASEFGLAITRATIEASSREGAAVYAATRTIADPALRREGVLFDEHKEDPESRILPKRDARAYDELFQLQARAFRRSGTAMRRVIALEEAALAADGEAKAKLRAATIERLVRRQLRLLSEAEARRADYLARPPAEAAGPERMPLMLGGELAVLASLAGAILLVRRRRSRA